jgi:hypothetical protein
MIRRNLYAAVVIGLAIFEYTKKPEASRQALVTALSNDRIDALQISSEPNWNELRFEIDQINTDIMTPLTLKE